MNTDLLTQKVSLNRDVMVFTLTPQQYTSICGSTYNISYKNMHSHNTEITITHRRN